MAAESLAVADMRKAPSIEWRWVSARRRRTTSWRARGRRGGGKGLQVRVRGRGGQRRLRGRGRGAPEGQETPVTHGHRQTASRPPLSAGGDLCASNRYDHAFFMVQ
uniref:Uncharacterized protein n=1 Tax=Triticum urartu TaxID=4572 RepID=A0A8R7UE73_TRIUA